MKTERWISVIFVLMIFAFVQTQALAGYYSGNALVPLMREYDKANANASDVDYVKAREYGAYIMGVYDATEFLYNVPDRATRGQIMAVVSKYLKHHPEKWTEPAASLVMTALKEAFPLKKSK